MSKEDLRYEYECMVAQCELFAAEDEIMLGFYIDELLDELDSNSIERILNFLEEDKYKDGYDQDLMESIIEYIKEVLSC